MDDWSEERKANHEARSKPKINLEEHMEIVPDWGPSDPRGTFLSGAIAGEAGELANLYKKEWRDGQSDERYRKIVKELADVGAYGKMLAHHLGIDWDKEIEASFLEFENRPEYKELLARVRSFRALGGPR